MNELNDIDMDIETKKQVFARNLQRLMDKQHISRLDFAQELGFRYSTLSEWLQGNKYPRMDKLTKVATYFGITVAELVKEPSMQAYANREIGMAIAAAREKRHWSQAELAQNGNFREHAVFNWEQGAFTTKHIDELNRLCNLLNLDPNLFAPIKGFMAHRNMTLILTQIEKEFPDVEMTESDLAQILDYAKYIVGKHL